MQSILDNINKHETWLEYLEFKKQQISCTKQEIQELEEYISTYQYKQIAEHIVNQNYVFSIPEKHLINKIGKEKKRAVYTFNKDETMILKIITYLFTQKYDENYCENCYSFRRKYTMKDAIYTLCNKNNNVKKMCGYKIDISNYFNSVDVEILLNKLKEFIADDNKLFEFIKNILIEPRVKFDNEIIIEKKGMMAGIPISSFLANIYLKDVDEYFKQKNIVYLRYSDDIIIFSGNIIEDSEMLDKLIKYNKLEINNDKRQFIQIGEKWSFLGFEFKDNIIDISDISKKKMKGQIRRAARKIRRWMIRKNASPEKAAKVLIKKFNFKFFGVENNNELTWCLWYFPIINTDNGLKEIDLYLQQYIRYLYTGKFGKKNYNIRYEDLKKLGYRTLVGEFYS